MLYIISGNSYREPQVIASCYMNNVGKELSHKVIR